MFNHSISASHFPSEHYTNDLKMACGIFGIFSIGLFMLLVLAALVLFRTLPILTKKQQNVVDGRSSLPSSILGYSTHGVSHLAIVLDGNRRYAKNKKKKSFNDEKIILLCNRVLESCPESPIEKVNMATNAVIKCLEQLLRETSLDGHRIGARNVTSLLQYTIEAGIPVLTLYAFSTENWKRNPVETYVLMALFATGISNITAIAQRDGIFVRFISTDIHPLPAKIQTLMKATEEITRNITPRKLVLNICVSYGGQQEISNACTAIVLSRLLSQERSPVSTDEIRKHMLRSITQSNYEMQDKHIFFDTPVEPQLVIRTGGDCRISNFLLFECAYSELYFTPKKWPEFGRDDFFHALSEYRNREKRYGK